MKKLQFKKLVLKDFKSFKGEHTLVFSEMAYGLHFIRGKNKRQPRLEANGAGKTTLSSHAICWCLYGKTADGLKGPDIKSWGGPKSASVALYVALDGKDHVISRSVSPNALLFDGEACGQETIDNFVGMSFDVFNHTIMQAQGQSLFLDLKPSEKMKLFSQVLDLDRWDKYSEKAALQTADLHMEVYGLDSRLNYAQVYIDKEKKIYEGLKASSEEWEAGWQKRITEDRDQLKKLEKSNEKFSKELQDAESSADIIATERRLFSATVKKAQKELAASQAEVDKAEAKLDVLRSEIKSQKRKLADSDGKTCPTCGQQIKAGQSKSHISEIKSSIKSLQQKVDGGVDAALTKAVRKKSKSLDALLEQDEQLGKRLSDAESTVRHLTPKVAELAAEIKSISKSIAKMETEGNPYRKQAIDSKKQIEKWEAEKVRLQKEHRKLSRKEARSKYWIKGFKDIKLYIIEEVLQEIELAANALLEEIGLIGWRMSFSSEKETQAGTMMRGINVMILSPNNAKPVRWENWSGGERQRLRLIGALALSEVLLNHAGIEPDLEILDEPTRSFSGQGVRDLCDLLAIRAKQIGRRIFLVDHNAIEGAQFSSVITVINDKNGSRIKRSSAQ